MMQKTIKILGIFMLVIFTALSFSSCSDNSEEDLMKDDSFAGVYRGGVSYQDADELPTKKWTNFLSPYAAILNLLIIS